ncbi:MAG: site-specific integrase [Bacteroidales bacterium]|jgi:site-specific recombinase XerD|nr:site-specific integrase [Bacteroidales bacterium]
MRSTFKILFYLKRDKQKNDGMIPLFCRITVDGKEARFSMKCDVNPKYWDVKTGKATGRTADAVKINALVDNTKASIYRVYRELQERDNYVTAEKVKNVFLGIESKHQTLLELFDRHNEERKELIGVNVVKGTYYGYCITRRRLSEFIRYKYNLHDVPFKDINHNFLGDFEIHLITQCQSAPNSVTKHLKRLRHIVGIALKNEWIYKNPFDDYKLRWHKTDRGYLTQEEVETLIECQFENPHMEKIRDTFIFCCFTGLAYTDIKSLTNENIQSSFDGRLWIKGRRNKTGTEYNIPILNVPAMIIEKYKGQTPDNRVLPVADIITYNKNLKKIAVTCGITKKITSHLARHTFATTITLSKGVPIETVSKMLGHTNLTTTQIYARILNSKISNDMTALAGKMKKLDMKLQFSTNREIVSVESIEKSLKIPTGRASDVIWEDLVAKVWNKLSDIEKQAFASDVTGMEKKPKTLRDFYVCLMDYFLENRTDNNPLNENTLIDNAVNF